MNNKKLTLAYVKRQAKKLKKEKSITHTEALESTAKHFGFSNYKHCHRSLSAQPAANIPSIKEQVQLSFADWLMMQKNRNSPLGDLANKRGFINKDNAWPTYDNLEGYQNYLRLNNPPMGATTALERAWKSYKAFLKRKNSSDSKKHPVIELTMKKRDPRTIIYVKNVEPLHYTKRTIEKFVVGDKAWISWEGRKALPVTITETDERFYTFIMERPLKKAGIENYVRLDEVRSTPELACINHIC